MVKRRLLFLKDGNSLLLPAGRPRHTGKARLILKLFISMKRSGQTSSSSSDDTSDGETTNTAVLADLLWHKAKKATPPATTVTLPCAVSKSGQTSSSTSSTKLLQTKKSEAVIVPHLHSSFCSILSSMKTKDTERNKKSTAQTSSKPTSSVRTIFERSTEQAMKAITTNLEQIKSKRQMKKEAKLEKTQWSWGKGKWASMRMGEETEENRKDLMVLSMRSTIDPTRHYKHTDLKAPKFFQMGTVQDDNYNYYTDRIPKKKRKQTLVEELMADEDFKRKLKQQYSQMKAVTANRRAAFQRKPPRKTKIKRK